MSCSVCGQLWHVYRAYPRCDGGRRANHYTAGMRDGRVMSSICASASLQSQSPELGARETRGGHQHGGGASLGERKPSFLASVLRGGGDGCVGQWKGGRLEVTSPGGEDPGVGGGRHLLTDGGWSSSPQKLTFWKRACLLLFVFSIAAKDSP